VSVRVGRFIARIIVLIFVIYFVLEGYLVLSGSSSITSYATNLVLNHNLYEVVPNKFYRSGRMSHDELLQVIREFRIKTVIDLRLGALDKYENGYLEREVVESAGVRYSNVRLNERIPLKVRLSGLLNAYDQAELPILVHCTSGTHRAGVATFIWLLDKEGWTIAEAKSQFSPNFGYYQIERDIRKLVTGTRTIDTLVWEYQQAYAQTGVSIRTWLNDISTPAPFYQF